MFFFKNAIMLRKLILILGDLIICSLSFYVGAEFRLYDPFLTFTYSSFFFRAVTFSVFIVFISFLMDLYSMEILDGRKELFLKILFTGFISFVTLAMIYYFIPSIEVGRGILLIAICVSVILRYLGYLIYDFGLKKIPGAAKHVLILGTGPVAQTLGKLFDFSDNHMVLAGYVNFINEPISVPREYIIEHGNGNGMSLLDIARKENAQKIIVSLSEKRGTLPIKEVLACKLNGIDVVDAPHFYEQIMGKLFIERMNPSHFIYSDGFRASVFSCYIKRVFDILFAVFGIVLAAPIMAIVAILIKLESSGPILYKQNRLGEGEKIFRLYKFRTMVDGAERDSGPVWSQLGDKRITKIGKILRKTRIDEIPQIINVIRGDMSFIGPRPERQFFIELLKKKIPYYSERHCVKPGITGWAQVRHEYGDSIGDALEKLKYDLYYIKYQSISLDMLITLDTIKVVLFGRGGR